MSFCYLKSAAALAIVLVCSSVAPLEVRANSNIAAQKRANALLKEGKDVPKLQGEAKVIAVRDMLRRFVDVPYIAKSSLGFHFRQWGKDAALMEEYIAAFESHVSRFLAEQMTENFGLAGFYAGEPIWLGGANKAIEIKMKAVNGSTEGTIVLEQSRGDGEYWITDLKVVGISLNIGFRTYVTGYLGANGNDIQMLISHLRGERR